MGFSLIFEPAFCSPVAAPTLLVTRQSTANDDYVIDLLGNRQIQHIQGLPLMTSSDVALTSDVTTNMVYYNPGTLVRKESTWKI